MRYYNLLVPFMALAACVSALGQGPTYNVGRTPTQEEIRSWDISVGPSGKELPTGSGTAKEGAPIYAQKCAPCHGPTGTEGPEHPLVGGRPLNPIHPVKTIESYWPFATTVWDVINRAMPVGQEGSLTPNEVYALTAFLLYRGNIIKESDVIDAKSLPKIEMPNRHGFVPPAPEWKPEMTKPFGVYP